MTDTLIAILSVFMGLIGANLCGIVFKKHSFGITGNTILGVFWSILFIKIFGRLGIDPRTIMEAGEMKIHLFVINMMVSLLGGGVGVLLSKWIKNKMDRGSF